MVRLLRWRRRRIPSVVDDDRDRVRAPVPASFVKTANVPLVGDEQRRDPFVGRQIGSYRVDRRLGAGGFGAVYVATHVRTGRRYALKVLRPDRALVSPDARERFRREAKALSGLGHIGIVAVHDYASSEGIDYLVMDLLEGEDLAQRLARRGRLPFAEVQTMVAAIAEALHAAHQAGIVHRDLKPANVFLAVMRGEGERPVLLDFGLAKDVDGPMDSLTGSGEALGTPAYMAPEQASAKPVDARTDVYALGALAYEMLAGRPPFVGGSAASVLLKVMTEPPTPLPDDVEVPSFVPAALERALAKDPADRFESTLAFRDALTLREEGPVYPPTRSMPTPETRPSLRPMPAAQSLRSIKTRVLPVGIMVGTLLAVGGAIVLSTGGERSAGVNARSEALVTPSVAEPVERDDVEEAEEAPLSSGPEVSPRDRVLRVSMEPRPPTMESRPTMEPRPRRLTARRVGAPPVELPDPPSVERTAAPAERTSPPSDPELESERRAELETLEALAARVTELRGALRHLERGHEPPLCTRGQRMSRRATSSTTVGIAQHLDRLRDEVCRPFRAAGELTPETRRRLEELERTIDRAGRMARDDSVSTNQPRAIAEAVAVAVDQARTVTEGAAEGRRAFDCDAPVWAELRRLATTENPWAAQAAVNVTRVQDRVCRQLGTSRAERERIADHIEGTLDIVEGQLRGMLRPLQAAFGGT